MRHRIHGKQLNRKSEHRKAMFKNLASGLFEHGQIETTMPKAKAVQSFVEKLITTAKKSRGLAGRRQLESRLNDRKLFTWLADPNVPEDKKLNAYFDLPSEDQIEFNRYGEVRKAPRLVQHLIERIAPMFEDRDGGYTRIIKLDKHRLGDGTDLVLLQLVGQEVGPQVGSGTSRRRQAADSRTAFAASLRKDGGSGSAVAEEEPAPEAEAPEAEVPEAETAPEAEVEAAPEAEAPEADASDAESSEEKPSEE
ncbi:MAG: 50S ribosomal protein L17 [Planctomycetota bacterium]|nr:50S ribosomal protein L17 [Planctomycetota bacterium]